MRLCKNLTAVVAATIVTTGSSHIGHAQNAEENSSDEVAEPQIVASTVDVDPEVSQQAKKRKKKKKRTPAHWEFESELGVEGRGGYFSGEGTLRESGGFIESAADAQLDFSKQRWRIRVPISAARRQAVGTDLNENRGRIGAAVRYRQGPKLKLTWRADLAGRQRSNWPDQYQPNTDGSLKGTDRFSRWSPKLGFDLAAVPFFRQHIQLEYSFERFDYRQDPAFAAVDAPTHLVPGDRTEHRLHLSWLHTTSVWKLGGGADAKLEQSAFAFSRDAGTGLTHAGAGGTPPNPLQRLRSTEPFLRATYGRIKNRFRINLRYGFEINDDTFQGYYSYTEHRPSVLLSLRPDTKTKLKLRAALYWRRYGANSYAVGGSHPALDYGDRRVVHRGTGSVNLERTISSNWALIGGIKVAISRTNFPDYMPGVFPSTRNFNIDWDSDNWQANAGAEWRY